jgi:hypothetical protein
MKRLLVIGILFVGLFLAPYQVADTTTINNPREQPTSSALSNVESAALPAFFCNWLAGTYLSGCLRSATTDEDYSNCWYGSLGIWIDCSILEMLW